MSAKSTVRAAALVALITGVVVGVTGCTEKTPGYCVMTTECSSGQLCDHNKCVGGGDGGSDSGDARDAINDGNDGGDRGDAGDVAGDLAPDEDPDAAGSCGAAGECSGAKPVCNVAAKVCVECMGDTDCDAMSATPMCKANVCVACTTAGVSTCSARTSTSKPVCETATGKCQECVDSLNDCKADAAKPICSTTTKTCVGCAVAPGVTAGACSARDTTTPACETATGKCWECVADSDCVTTGKPICNVATHVCRPCGADSECVAKTGSADPGVCVEGTCPASSDVIYVKAGGTCNEAGTGTLAAPFCTAQKGTDRLKVASETRRIVVMRGTIATFQLVGPPAATVVGKINIIGQNATMAVGGTTYGVDLSNVTVLVRDMIVQNGTAAAGAGIHVVKSGMTTDVTLSNVTTRYHAGEGVEVTSATIVRMDRCLVLSNNGGGLQLSSTDFDVTNSISAFNGTSGTAFGGVFLGTSPGSTRHFQNNTVYGNFATSAGVSGVDCSGTYTIAASIVYANDPPAGTVGAGCVVTWTNIDDGFWSLMATNFSAAPNLVNAGLNNFHLKDATSPCVDALDPADATSYDYDGRARPQGSSMKSDCGAYEF